MDISLLSLDMIFLSPDIVFLSLDIIFLSKDIIFLSLDRTYLSQSVKPLKVALGEGKRRIFGGAGSSKNQSLE